MVPTYKIRSQFNETRSEKPRYPAVIVCMLVTVKCHPSVIVGIQYGSIMANDGQGIDDDYGQRTSLLRAKIMSVTIRARPTVIRMRMAVSPGGFPVMASHT